MAMSSAPGIIPAPPADEDEDLDDGTGTGEPAAPRQVVGHQGRPVPPEAVSSIKAEARQQERRRLLTEEYGTADPVEIAKIRESRKSTSSEYERLKREREDQDRASLSEVERLKLENGDLKKRITELESASSQWETKVKVEKQDRAIATMALKFLEPESVDFAKYQLNRHVRELPPEQRRRVNDRYLERWFTKWASEHPKMAKEDPAKLSRSLAAKEAAAKAAAKKAAETRAAKADADAAAARGAPRAPIKPAIVRPPAAPTRPAAAAARPAPAPASPRAGMFAGKTTLPGRPNSMSPKELRAYKASIGLRG